MRILFVENHAELAAAVVSTFLGGHDVVVVPTIAGAKRLLADARFDVALVDYDLDDGKGDELVRWLRGGGGAMKLVGISARDAGNEALLAAGVDAICAKLQLATIATVLESLGR